MAKKKITDIALKLRKLLADKKLIIGIERTLKSLKQHRLSAVYISSNCSQESLEKMEKYCQLANVEIKKLGLLSDELGIICKKPFSIAVLGVLKGK